MILSEGVYNEADHPGGGGGGSLKVLTFKLLDITSFSCYDIFSIPLLSALNVHIEHFK